MVPFEGVEFRNCCVALGDASGDDAQVLGRTRFQALPSESTIGRPGKIPDGCEQPVAIRLFASVPRRFDGSR